MTFFEYRIMNNEHSNILCLIFI